MCRHDILDLRALQGFEHWQSIISNKGLPLGSVKDHPGSIGGVDASRIEVVLDGISPSTVVLGRPLGLSSHECLG